MTDRPWIGVEAVAWARGRAKGPAEQAVLLTLASYADECGVTWVSQDTLAKDCGSHKSTLVRYLNRLEGQGLISRVRQADDGGHRAVNLTVLAPAGARGGMDDLPVNVAELVEAKFARVRVREPRLDRPKIAPKSRLSRA